MKLHPVLLAAPLALPLFAAQHKDEGGLMRVQPLDEGEKMADQEPAEPFDPQSWRRALGESDLDLRERDFERILRLARKSDEAWSFLKELSEDASAPELAWTARLALRELETGGGPRSFFQPFAGPGVRLSDPYSDLSELLEQFDSGALGVPGGLFQLYGGQGSAGPGSQSSQERRIQIEHDGDQWRLHIHETKDGKEETREFSGPSLEAILQENPELGDELGLFHLGGPEGFRMDMGLPPGAELPDILQGLDGFRRLQPLHGFEFKSPDGSPRHLRFLLSPQEQSRPVRTDVLGVRVIPVTAELAHELGLAGPGGLYVQTSFPGTIAHLLGVKGGDVLLELDGAPLGSAEDITRVLRGRPEERPVRLVWIDATGERMERTWTPEPAPNAAKGQTKGF